MCTEARADALRLVRCRVVSGAPAEFVDEKFGLPTVTDILAELDKPGRDPRPAFQTAVFAEGVDKLTDLRPGMVVTGMNPAEKTLWLVAGAMGKVKISCWAS